MNDELKPCPFCGSEDIESIGFASDFSTRPHICCNHCGVDVYDAPNIVPIWHRNDFMVQAWNTRANDNMTAESVISDKDVDANDGSMAQADSQEQLEADLREWVEIATYKSFTETRMLEVMHHWLDRQAAITRADDAQVIENAENYNLRPGIVCQFIPDGEKHELAANDNLSAETDISADGHARNDTMMDDRERLRADVYDGFSAVDLPEQMRDVLRARVHGWLDRQEAITSKEWCYSHDALEEELERVRAERDELKDRLEMELGSMSGMELTIDKLKAERDQLSSDLEAEHALAMQLQDDADRLRTERDELKQRVSELELSIGF